MRILITGHNGYLGSVMTPALLAAGHDLVGLDSFYYDECMFGEETSQIPALKKDIRDIAPDDIQGFDAVVHLAGLSNDPLGDLKPEWTHEINYVASVNLAKMARAAGVRRFIFASSCSMYGAAGDRVLTEDAPLHPLTPYAESKVRTEEELSRLADSGFSPVFMRNATAYGLSPHLRADLVLNNLTCWAFATGKVRIMSDGSPWRPIVHVKDIAQAFVAALSAPRAAVHNQALNVGANAENYQVRDIAAVVQETVPNCEIEYANKTGPDPRNYRVDFSKVERTLPGFKAAWTARKGVEELYKAFCQYGLRVEDFQGRKFVRLAQLQHLLQSGALDSDLRWQVRH